MEELCLSIVGPPILTNSHRNRAAGIFLLASFFLRFPATFVDNWSLWIDDIDNNMVIILGTDGHTKTSKIAEKFQTAVRRQK